MKQSIKELKTFFVLWSTQSLSQLGSAMTSFALALWLYGETGSALQTALLSVCSYAPYVVMSVFAGALSDRWDKKKTMLACDSLAAPSLTGCASPGWPPSPRGACLSCCLAQARERGQRCCCSCWDCWEWRSAWYLGGCCESIPSGRSLDKRRFNCLFKHIIQTAERE